MSIKREFTFLSRDGITNCHAIEWAPDNGEIKAVFQIIHGMQEYVDRYDEFARYLTEKGFLVVGEDHLGHGKTAPNPDELGYFAKHHSDTIVVRDVHRLKKITQKEHPGVPYYIMGHSMGSFIMRKYLTMYGKGIDGSIVMGTGMVPKIFTGTGIFLSHLLKICGGDHHRSKLITNASFKSYNNRIPNPRTPNDWLSVNEDNVNKYIDDPLSTFMFTLNGYRTLFKLAAFVCKKKNLTTIPKSLPIFVISGEEDPVGNYGEGPKAVYAQFKEIGIEDVELKLYPVLRHEILNEKERVQVYNDIYNWVDKHMNQ